MSRDTRRKAVLLAIVAILALAVVVDRSGLLRSSDPEPNAAVATDLSPAERYRAEAAALAAQRAVLDRADRLTEARDAARDEWDRLADRLIAAPTRPLAFSGLRDALRQRVEAVGVRNPVIREDAAPPSNLSPSNAQPSSPTDRRDPAAAPPADDRLFTIRASLQFDADTEAAYQAIAAVESMTSPALRVVALDLSGPGMNTARRTLSVTLTVEAVGRLTQSNAAANAPLPPDGGRPR